MVKRQRKGSPGCPSGKIRNPRSGRCVKRDGKVGQEVLRNLARSRSPGCPSGKIRNPRSGRCVKRDGKVGQEVLRNLAMRSRSRTKHRSQSYVSPSPYSTISSSPSTSSYSTTYSSSPSTSSSYSTTYSSSPSTSSSYSTTKCRSSEVFNVRTGVCVDKRSPAGKKLMKQYQTEFLELYGRELIPRGFRVSRVLGSGIQGTVYELKSITYDDRLALKLQNTSDKLHNEIDVHQHFARKGLAPRILRVKVSSDPPISGILMEKIDGTLQGVMEDKGNKWARYADTSRMENIAVLALQLIQRMCDHNLIHGDLHWENIAFRWVLDTSGRELLEPILIDFGSSVSGVECNPRLELLQLLRTLDPDFMRKVSRQNSEYLRDILHQKYVETYGRLKKDYDEYDRKYGKMMDAHYDKYSYI